MEEFGTSSSKSSPILSLFTELTQNDAFSASPSAYQPLSEASLAQPDIIQPLLSIILTNLRSPAKEWRKINKTLNIVIFLLKHGSPLIFDELRQKQGGFKELMEFFYIENRLDKGGVVRDKARLVFFMLSTPGFIDSERGYSKKHVSHSGWQAEEAHRPEIRRTEPRSQEIRPKPLSEVKKPVNVFEGVKVKDQTQGTQKKAQEIDLIGSFETLPSKPAPSATQNLLFLDTEVKISTNHHEKNDLIDISLDVQQPAKPSAPESKNEPKVICNIEGQGLSMNVIKTIPSVIKPTAPPPPPPKDLESRLLSLDDLSFTPAVEKKPAHRPYY